MQQVQQLQQEQIILPIGSIVRNVNGDRYTVEGLLGKGGSGAVYLVRDRRNKENIFALKELIDPDKGARERFAFEAEVLMRLDNEALPHVYRVFENEKLKRVYILMDYIEGQDLEVMRKEQPDQRFSLDLVLALLTPIVVAINYLHHCEPPIVHRDIKPANIVVPVKGGDAVLVDFGIAKEQTEDGTTTIIRRGSPGYAALEQYGGGTNTRTDVYGLGATLYTLLTGVIPVDALTRVDSLAGVTGTQGVDPVRPAHELVPDLSVGVSNVISRALSIRRDDRYATINEFWTEVNTQAKADEFEKENTTAGDSVTDKLVSPARRVPRFKKDITPMTLAEQRQIASVERRRATILSFVSAFLILLLVGVGITALVLRLPHAVVVGRTTPVVSSSPSLPPATPTVDQSPYSTLASSYKGSMHDEMNGSSINSYLAHMQQNKGTIQGFCTCLGLAGPFTGKIGLDNSITFTVTTAGGDTGILFEGHIKTGGSMAGVFYIITVSNGQHTGEYGEWSFI